MMSGVIIADVRSYRSDGTIKGHGFAVASNYLSVFRGVSEVKVAGGPAYKARFGDDAVLLPYDTEASRPAWLNKLRTMLNMRRLFRSCCDDTIIIQSSGVATAFLGVALFKRKQTRVFIILYNEEALNTCLKRLFFRWGKGKITGIICPNDRVGTAHGLPYCVVPDYLYCRAGNAGQAEKIPYEEKHYDFCMVGLIWRDKGMVEVARYLAGSRYKLLIAGGVSGEVGLEDELREACSGAENIELRIGYLSQQEYDAAIRSSRYCILNYSGAYSEHSSGVVFDVLFRGVPVIARRCETMTFVEAFGVGYIYEKLNDLRPERLLNEEVYADYLQHMEAYYAAHQQYQKCLQKFILPDENAVDTI